MASQLFRLSTLAALVLLGPGASAQDGLTSKAAKVYTGTGEVIDDIMGWDAMSDPSQPRFAWVHLYDAHFPHQGANPMRDKK